MVLTRAGVGPALEEGASSSKVWFWYGAGAEDEIDMQISMINFSTMMTYSLFFINLMNVIGVVLGETSGNLKVNKTTPS